MRRWNILLRVFMSEYLHLRPQDLKRRSVDNDSSRMVAKNASELVRLSRPIRSKEISDQCNVYSLSSRPRSRSLIHSRLEVPHHCLHALDQQCRVGDLLQWSPLGSKVLYEQGLRTFASCFDTSNFFLASRDTLLISAARLAGLFWSSQPINSYKTSLRKKRTDAFGLPNPSFPLGDVPSPRALAGTLQ